MLFQSVGALMFYSAMVCLCIGLEKILDLFF